MTDEHTNLLPSQTELPPVYDEAITAAHIKELIDTNKALRESVISIAALLKEQTLSVTYPGRVECGTSIQPSSIRHDDGHDRSQHAPHGSGLNREGRRQRYEEQWRESGPMSLEAIENERMKRREAYEDRWTTSTLHPQAEKAQFGCPTLLSYDDPWWDIVSNTLREVSMVDQPQSRKFDTALRGGLQYELFVALFGSEFNHKWCDASRPVFEESRRFRLGQIIHKLQDTGAVSYFGKDFAMVLIEVAEWTKTVWTRRPEGAQTLEALRSHCYRRRVLLQPGSSDYRSVEQQNEGLLAILYALDLRKWWNIGGSWQQIVKDLDTDRFPLEVLIPRIDQCTGWTEKMKTRIHDMEPSKGMSVDPKDINSRAFRDLGDLEIVWTPELDMHLKMSLDGKRVYVFQYPTWLIGRRFHSNTSWYSLQDEAAESNKIFHDLAETYALLFGPSTDREFKQLQSVLQNTDTNAYFLGVPLWRSLPGPDSAVEDKIELHPEHGATRTFLDNFRTINLPHSMIASQSIGSRTSTMADALRSGPPYNDDMTIMMLSIIRYYPLSGSFNWSGSHFEEELRMLKAFMDNRKPRTIGQLWKDARDATSWWTFWAVLFFGIVSILLAAGSLIVSIVQTVLQAVD
ncbi:hypothetical protein MMC13_006143 [Lambiella insularis]|nr:hypothetical protein [Lambiella insularis]